MRIYIYRKKSLCQSHHVRDLAQLSPPIILSVREDASVCTYRVDRSATTASCASSSQPRNADLSPGISSSCTTARRGTFSSGVRNRSSHPLARDVTVYRCRFSVIPLASCGPKEEQERATIWRAIICDVPGLWFTSKSRSPSMLALSLRLPPWARNRPADRPAY